MNMQIYLMYQKIYKNKSDDIKCLLEKKVNELYKQEINNIKIVNK